MTDRVLVVSATAAEAAHVPADLPLVITGLGKTADPRRVTEGRVDGPSGHRTADTSEPFRRTGDHGRDP